VRHATLVPLHSYAFCSTFVSNGVTGYNQVIPSSEANSVPSFLAERLWKLVQLIVQAGGFGSVSLILEKGRVARIVWSVDERIRDPQA